jgi:hypothetical protein
LTHGQIGTAASWMLSARFATMTSTCCADFREESAAAASDVKPRSIGLARSRRDLFPIRRRELPHVFAVRDDDGRAPTITSFV